MVKSLEERRVDLMRRLFAETNEEKRQAIELVLEDLSDNIEQLRAEGLYLSGSMERKEYVKNRVKYLRRKIILFRQVGRQFQSALVGGKLLPDDYCELCECASLLRVKQVQLIQEYDQLRSECRDSRKETENER